LLHWQNAFTTLHTYLLIRLLCLCGCRFLLPSPVLRFFCPLPRFVISRCRLVTLCAWLRSWFAVGLRCRTCRLRAVHARAFWLRTRSGSFRLVYTHYAHFAVFYTHVGSHTIPTCPLLHLRYTTVTTAYTHTRYLQHTLVYTTCRLPGSSFPVIATRLVRALLLRTVYFGWVAVTRYTVYYVTLLVYYTAAHLYRTPVTLHWLDTLATLATGCGLPVCTFVACTVSLRLLVNAYHTFTCFRLVPFTRFWRSRYTTTATARFCYFHLRCTPRYTRYNATTHHRGSLVRAYTHPLRGFTTPLPYLVFTTTRVCRFCPHTGYWLPFTTTTFAGSAALPYARLCLPRYLCHIYRWFRYTAVILVTGLRCYAVTRLARLPRSRAPTLRGYRLPPRLPAVLVLPLPFTATQFTHHTSTVWFPVVTRRLPHVTFTRFVATRVVSPSYGYVTVARTRSIPAVAVGCAHLPFLTAPAGSRFVPLRYTVRVCRRCTLPVCSLRTGYTLPTRLYRLHTAYIAPHTPLPLPHLVVALAPRLPLDSVTGYGSHTRVCHAHYAVPHGWIPAALPHASWFPHTVATVTVTRSDSGLRAAFYRAVPHGCAVWLVAVTYPHTAAFFPLPVRLAARLPLPLRVGYPTPHLQLHCRLVLRVTLAPQLLPRRLPHRSTPRLVTLVYYRLHTAAVISRLRFTLTHALPHHTVIYHCILPYGSVLHHALRYQLPGYGC